ncbi:lipopolysaccharide biosynthesis protein [Psychromonas aquimarina]|uniref:lipopolysaccharide biosynthesis protein n=1 Tax=Psychromonas aquimarina TaxID=444919 RepID=UPI00040AB000|nr:lipopolysaccharide biosynthesis protein [Psychromonas aquimarina]
MKMRLNNGIKQSIIYGASIALMKGVSLLVLPFVANQISAQEFGRLEVISTIAVIGSILVGMGLEDTLFRFAGTAQTERQKRHIASEIFSLTLIIALTAFIFGWSAAPSIAAWIPGNAAVYELRLVLSVLALEGCIAVPLGWLRMNNKAVSFFFTTTGRALLQALLVVVLLYSDRGVAGILEAGLAAAAVQTFVLSYVQIRNTGLSFSVQTGRRSFLYSLPIVGSGLVAFSLNGLDRWILADHASLADVAEFGIAAKFALAAVLIFQPFGMWWSPRRFEVLNETNGRQKAADFIAMGTSLALLTAVVVGLLAPALISALLPQSYQTAGKYAVALVLVMLLKELAELFNIGCFSGDTTSSQLLINLAGAVTGISGMLWLTPQYQVWGIIFSLLSAQFIRLLLFYKTSQYFLPLSYPVRPLLVLSSISMLWLLIGSQISSFWQLIVVLLTAAASLLLSAQQLKLINLPISFFTKVTEQ